MGRAGILAERNLGHLERFNVIVAITNDSNSFALVFETDCNFELVVGIGASKHLHFLHGGVEVILVFQYNSTVVDVFEIADFLTEISGV